MAGRTRTFVDDTGSEVVRGLNESLMSSRIPLSLPMFVPNTAPAENSRTLLLLYASEDVYPHDLRVHNFTAGGVAGPNSYVRFAICSNQDLTTGASVIANIEDFDTHNWAFTTVKDMSAITTSDADTVTAFIPQIIPAGNYLYCVANNDEAANPLGLAIYYGLYGTSERVALTPAIPAKAHYSSTL